MGGWVILKGCPQQTTVGEALGVKGRNSIGLAHYKRKVTTAEREEEKRRKREKTPKEKGPKGVEAPKGKNPW